MRPEPLERYLVSEHALALVECVFLLALAAFFFARQEAEIPGLIWFLVAFLTVPMFSLFLSLRNQAPWNRKELFMLVIISCIGWVTNHFTGTKFSGQNDISAAVGYVCLAPLYPRFPSWLISRPRPWPR